MTDAWFDKFTIGAAKILIPLWMPLAVGSLIAVIAKALLKIEPAPEGPRNLILRIACIVRYFALLLVRFFFGFLFWYVSYSRRQGQTMIDQDAIDRAIAP